MLVQMRNSPPVVLRGRGTESGWPFSPASVDRREVES
jgi:hypothetical protein